MTIVEYRSADGRCPYQEWLSGLDEAVEARIEARVSRLRLGNLGDYRQVAKGVYEARLMFGSGYRLYFSRIGSRVLLLLVGGDKRSQRSDIARAYWYRNDFLARSRHGQTS